jgi:Spy/CpxP family protein refolding chaperone
MMKRRALFASLALITALPALAADFHVPGANRLDFLTGYLGLTDQQKASAKTIFDAADAATTTAEGQLTAAHDALTAAIKANKADIDLEKLAAAAGTIEGNILAIHAKAETKFYALLTTDQKAKYDAFGTRTGPGPGGPGKH